MVTPRHLAVALVIAASMSACNAESPPGPPSTPASSFSPEVAQAEEQAQNYLSALVGKSNCSAVWDLVDPSSDDKTAFCDALRDYRTEVSDLTLGAVTDSAEDYTIFTVRVDYQDGRAAVTDSEVEIDVVDGKPLVAAGLP